MTVTAITGVRAGARRQEQARVASRRSMIMVLIPVAILLVVGLGALLSASSVPSLHATGAESPAAGDSFFYFKRQMLWLGLGAGAFAVGVAVPYRLYRRWAIPIFVASTAGLLAVLAFGTTAGGSRRWIAVGPFTVQPSEFTKFAVVVFLAAVMVRKQQRLREFGHFLAPVVLGVGVSGALVVVQPDLGTALIIAAAAMAVLVASSAPLSYVVGSAVIGAGSALMLARTSEYRWARVTAFLDPFADRFDTGLQAVQSLLALGSGGWFGLGLGASRARWAFLPNAHTDFIFAIIGEETGFVGTLSVVVLFGAFTVGGMVVAARALDPFGRMLAAGLTAWIACQALVNVGGVTGLLPITGVPLPFVSFGGTALVTELAAVGVLVNIARARVLAER